MALRTALVLIVLTGVASAQSGSPLGIFEGEADIGTVLHPGSVAYDAATRAYTVTSGGENMWAATDDFHYVWKKAKGDLTLTADAVILGAGGHNHRKAVLMIRQGLETDAPYASVALHGDGLTSLQSREEKGGITREVQSRVSRPVHLRLAKRGDMFYAEVALDGQPLAFSGGAMKLHLTEPFYVGIGVCAHDRNRVESARFANVQLEAARDRQPVLYSTVETLPVLASTDRRTAHTAPGRITAPTWTPDGSSLLFSQEGRLQRIPFLGGTPEFIEIGGLQCVKAGISPEGTRIAASCGGDLYVAAFPGGKPAKLARAAEFGSWSPDSAFLAYSSAGAVFSVPVEGGEPKRLSDGEAPEYSRDGKSIYFHATRSGAAQVWRMDASGSNQEQVTSGAGNNAFPKVSPDGQRIAFLNDTSGLNDRDIELRVMTLSDGHIRTVGKFTGGPGTLGASAWTPDGRRLTYVTYQWLR